MKIKIKEPCDADWSKMKIGMKSRHCELCVKNVMDFTAMTREEILIYLFRNNNKSTCARMYGGQMDFHFQELEAIVEGTRKQKGNLPFMVLSFATLAMMSCNSLPGNNNYEPTTGKIVVVPKSDTTQDKIKPLLKDTSEVLPTKLGKVVKPKCTPTKRGEIEIENGEIITGDLIAEPEVDGMIEVLMPEPEIMGAMVAEPFPTESREAKVYDIAEKMPEFVNGADSLLNYLANEISYPKKAQKKGVEGRVYVQFVVEKDGKITRAKVLRGIGSGCDEEALRVINSMINWIPGENNGKKVAVKYTLPIKFVLK